MSAKGDAALRPALSPTSWQRKDATTNDRMIESVRSPFGVCLGGHPPRGLRSPRPSQTTETTKATEVLAVHHSLQDPRRGTQQDRGRQASVRKPRDTGRVGADPYGDIRASIATPKRSIWRPTSRSFVTAFNRTSNPNVAATMRDGPGDTAVYGRCATVR
jgi:hypothetical protein